MSQTLSNGYKKPQTGDRGSSFFPDLEFDIQRLNDHNHDGTNSELLTSAAMTAETATAASGSWVVSGARYRQSVSMPAGMAFDDYQVLVKDSSGIQVLAKIEKINASSFYVYTNLNTATYTIYFIS